MKNINHRYIALFSIGILLAILFPIPNVYAPLSQIPPESIRGLQVRELQVSPDRGLSLAVRAVRQGRVVDCDERDGGIILTYESEQKDDNFLIKGLREIEKMARERQRKIAKLMGMPLGMPSQPTKSNEWQVTINNRCDSSGRFVERICDSSRSSGYQSETTECPPDHECYAPPSSSADCRPTCGNGLLNPSEQCEGSNMQGLSCGSFGFYNDLYPWILRCTLDCRLDISDCHGNPNDPYGTPPEVTIPETGCGNFMLDAGEVCDHRNLGPPDIIGGGVTCQSRGYLTGSITCNSTCDGISTANCRINAADPYGSVPPPDPDYVAACENGFRDEGELCETVPAIPYPRTVGIFDGDTMSTASCASRGYAQGGISCADNCQRVSTQGCVCGTPPGDPYGIPSPPTEDPDYVTTCGDRCLDPNEECDRTPGGYPGFMTSSGRNPTCTSLGYTGPGPVVCSGCELDISNCF